MLFDEHRQRCDWHHFLAQQRTAVARMHANRHFVLNESKMNLGQIESLARFFTESERI